MTSCLATRASGRGGTFVANLAGAALLGYFVTRLQERLPRAIAGPLWGPGSVERGRRFRRCSLSSCKCLTSAPGCSPAGTRSRALTAGFACVFAMTRLARRVSFAGGATRSSRDAYGQAIADAANCASSSSRPAPRAIGARPASGLPTTRSHSRTRSRPAGRAGLQEHRP